MLFRNRRNIKGVNKNSLLSFLKAILIISCFTVSISSRSDDVNTCNQSYQPECARYPMRVFWGDTHLHTNLSLDAFAWGNTGLSIDQAYRFAQGRVVKSNSGINVKLKRPLDFLVIADHAIQLGLGVGVIGNDPILYKNETEKKLYTSIYALLQTDRIDDESLFKILGNHEANKDYQRKIWNRIISTADNENHKEGFTAFIGYEWSAFGRQSGNLHRVVIFKDGGDKVSQVLPFSKLDGSKPEQLWAYLDSYARSTGGDAIAIPHNSNLSSGLMFNAKLEDGADISQAYATTRSLWEPLLEVTQIKGDSETHPSLSPNDEFADYETWNSWFGNKNLCNKNDSQNLATKYFSQQYLSAVSNCSIKDSEYARSALKIGLQKTSTLGVNPFKFGLIGSTDSHTSLATADENNFMGKVSISEPSATRLFANDGVIPAPGWDYAASGYMAIWAEENTRESLFAAMKRKEVYASTGPRINLRFFGGWDYQKSDAFRPDLARIGYQQGVPMGGDLTAAPDNKEPSFLIRAVKDPDGANLDRVQVIKGWHDANGELHEKVYNVALSDNRQVNWRGQVKAVGNTVDIADASYTNTIGDPELAVVWRDPDFDKDELAFYYLRVLEIPTPRWTAYDAKRFQLNDLPDEIPMITQERAYSSPIWYSPPAKAGGE